MKFLTFVLVFAFSFSTWAFDHSHKVWDNFLKQHVVKKGPQSRVNYKGAKTNFAQLQPYFKELESVTQKQFDGWSVKQQQAYLINAYNAWTVKFIVDNYPVKSIKDLGGFLSSAWKKKFFKLFGKKQHLDHIEHKILRVKYNEPRIHFALVCASIGCPPLSRDAWVADKLDQQYDDAARSFLRDTERNRYNAKKNELELSKIFDWFEKDFKKSKAGSVAAFVAPYITDDPALQAKFKAKKVDVENHPVDYNWDLNDIDKKFLARKDDPPAKKQAQPEKAQKTETKL